MKIKIFSKSMPYIGDQPIEMVERKGIGHPDTLADLIAMDFSNKYSNYSLNKYGVIPNHWADKVTIVGAKAKIDFGKGQIKRPIKIFQFGRVTPDIGSEKINIKELFKESVNSIFSRIFGKNFKKEYICCELLTHDGSGPDHPKEFYDPHSVNGLKLAQKDLKSNDTIMLTSFASLSKLEELVIETENFLNSTKFKSKYPATGYDIKVLAARVGKEVDLTICIPFIGEKTPNFYFYKQELLSIKENLEDYFEKNFLQFKIKLNLNTKDYKEHTYLTLFGTSCDKGGCGAVGRGNKYNGLITLNREMAVEAPAGKNPTHHSGRLYSEALHRLSKKIYGININHFINLVARNGEELDNPAIIVVKGINKINRLEKKKIEKTIYKEMKNVPDLVYEIIKEDPIYSHINKSKELYKKGDYNGF